MAFGDITIGAHNEQVKLIATTLQQLSVALAIASIALWWVRGLDLTLAIWLLIAIFGQALGLATLRFIKE
jgi:Na+/glutamate symporter